MYVSLDICCQHVCLSIVRFGCCEIVISDQGREFVNRVKDKLLSMTGTEHRVTSAYHPQSNGLTESFNQMLQTTLVKVVNETQNDWDEHLPAILFAYCNSILVTHHWLVFHFKGKHGLTKKKWYSAQPS